RRPLYIPGRWHVGGFACLGRNAQRRIAQLRKSTRGDGYLQHGSRWNAGHGTTSLRLRTRATGHFQCRSRGRLESHSVALSKLRTRVPGHFQCRSRRNPDVIDIYIPSGRFLEGEISEAKVGLEGWYTLRARRRSGRVSRERVFKVEACRGLPPFRNLITDLGLNRFGSTAASSVYSRCHVGTGTATPSVTDTQLQNFLAAVGGTP